ncbi:conjugal transfer protein TraX [bacterium]|nr:conjugal transfer protein TraX [bacterium]
MSSFTLKILAIIFMTIDHIGFLLFPEISILRKIGRLAFPIFAFQVGIGFKHTRSKEKYIFRMLLFTLISQLPYTLALQTAIPGYAYKLNIGATLTLGLLALYCIEKFGNKWLKYLTCISIILISAWIPIDYGWTGVLMIVILYYLNKEKLLVSAYYIALICIDSQIDNSTFNLPQIFALIPILMYNGKKGPNIKYLFYAFYPVHLIVLVLLKGMW